MDKNSFKELENLIIDNRGESGNITKKNIQSNIQFFELIGNLVELYVPNVPKILQCFDKSQYSESTQNPIDPSSNNTTKL